MRDGENVGQLARSVTYVIGLVLVVNVSPQSQVDAGQDRTPAGYSRIPAY